VQRIDPRETALIIVDMQNYFAHPNGTAFRDYEGAIIQNPHEIIFPIQRLIEHAQKMESPVIFLFSMLNYYIDDWDNQIIKEFSPHKEGLVISKEKDDGFSNPVLDLYLKEKDVKNVIICGLLSNCCVKETALGAQEKGYRVYIATDAVFPDLTDAQYESFFKSPDSRKRPIKIPPIFVHTSEILETVKG